MDNRPLNVRNEYQQLSQETLKILQRNLSMNCDILLFNIRTDGNLGMIVRTACLMGCHSVIICGRKHYDKRFTVGSDNYIPVHFWESPLKVTITCKKGLHYGSERYQETLEYFPEEFVRCCENRTPVFLEQGGTDIREVSWKLVENPLVILGNESIGIPSNFIQSVKKLKPETITVSIPQWSVMRSLNVSIACSLILWEIRNQK